MKIASTFSGAELCVDILLVKVESDVLSGLPKMLIVELVETLVRKYNPVEAAITISHFECPSRKRRANIGSASLPSPTIRHLAYSVNPLTLYARSYSVTLKVARSNTSLSAPTA
jgi:hypothetical protein